MTGLGNHVLAGTTAGDGFALDVTPDDAGWTYCGLRVVELAPGETAAFDTGTAETLVLSLSGGCTVDCAGERIELAGRGSVFEGVSDVVYLPRDAGVLITSARGGRFALPSAVCERQLPVQHLSAEAVQVELRGAGRASRQVNNFGTPGVLDADRIICCEVLTPAGNWSSYPPHKHDEDRDGESVLEEIYYFEVDDGPQSRLVGLEESARSAGGIAGAAAVGGIPGGGAPRGIAYQRVYGHEKAEIDVLAEVRSGDVVLIPYGWHGPSMAVPGYDLYYLNVMAGPGERVWQICDDPAHAWVRDTWEHEEIDSRLPFQGEGVR